MNATSDDDDQAWVAEMDSMQQRYAKRSAACAAVRADLAGVDMRRVRDPGGIVEQMRAHIDLTEDLLAACQERDAALRALDATTRANDGQASPELMTLAVDLDRRAAGLQIRCDIAAEALQLSIDKWPVKRRGFWRRHSPQAAKVTRGLVPRLLAVTADLQQYAPDWTGPQS